MPTTLRGIVGTLDHSILQPFLTVEGAAGGAYCAMEESDYRALFGDMHPGFFEQPQIRALPARTVYEEMILPLAHDHPDALKISLPPGVAFGMHEGDRTALLRAVAAVDGDWPQYFGNSDSVYCAFVGGQVASFCIVEDMGVHRGLRIAGPGCVGTVPAYRRQGIGLKLVQNVTGMLKERGYSLSWIHYTGVASWYARLGYRTVLRWNRDGFLD